MKTASFPSLRVDPELRQAAEQSLHEGETISSFVEQAIRETIARRQNQKEFLIRGMRAREEAQRSGDYVPAEAVMQRLEGMLAKAKAGK